MPSSALSFDYSSIDKVYIQFSNPILKSYASDQVINLSPFFVDNSRQVLAPNLLDVITEQTIAILDANCQATTMHDRIPALVDKCPFSWYSTKDQRAYRLRSQNLIVDAFQKAVQDKVATTTIVTIRVLTEALHFSSTFNGCNLDFVSTDDFPVSEAPSPPFEHLSHGSSAAITQEAPVPSNEFRHNLLPVDVKKRYDDHQDQNKVVPVHDLVPFGSTPDQQESRLFFHNSYVAGDKVILRNGGVLSATYDSKRFHKNIPTCLDVSPHGLRSWYRLFSGHGNSCGIYIVPYELFAKGHGGAIGFDFGIDIPQFKSGYFFDWQNDILRALQHSSMFPLNSEPAQRAMGRQNGYYTIMAILTDSHPSFIEHPITLCKDWPCQKAAQTIFDFHTEFVEAIRLRAIFMNDTQDLNSPLMLSTFMHNCLHSAYLLQVSRIDRQDPTSAHLFNPGTIAITLNTYLNNVDSPTRRAASTPPGTFAPSGSGASRFGEGSSPGYRRPYQRNNRINALRDEDIVDDPVLDLDPYVFEPYLDNIVNKLAGDGPELRHCMFCGPNELHMFDKCPILNDKRFSSTLAIRLGSTYQRTLKEAVQRQKESHGGTPHPSGDRRRPPPRDTHAARIHQLFGAEPASPSLAPVPASSPPDFLSPDFVPGSGPDFLQG
jgi:hypothetical protein